jgi:pimeloyl-ACP methyl ester carboxylesterase
MMRRWLTLVVAGLTVTVLAGCSLIGGTTLSTPKPGVYDPRNEKFYTQVLTWSPCDTDFTCTRVSVPVDWSAPEGDTTEIALIRHAATAETGSRGSLFVNPGGPGGSGVALVRDSLDYAVDAELTAQFDVIGFDPRGVGESDPVTCTPSSSAMDEFVYSVTPGERGSSEWLNNRRAEIEAFASGCQKYSGALLAHVDTLSAARDLDVLRAAVGDEKLNFLGYSLVDE